MVFVLRDLCVVCVVVYCVRAYIQRCVVPRVFCFCRCALNVCVRSLFCYYKWGIYVLLVVCVSLIAFKNSVSPYYGCCMRVLCVRRYTGVFRFAAVVVVVVHFLYMSVVCVVLLCILCAYSVCCVIRVCVCVCCCCAL